MSLDKYFYAIRCQALGEHDHQIPFSQRIARLLELGVELEVGSLSYHVAGIAINSQLVYLVAGRNGNTWDIYYSIDHIGEGLKCEPWLLVSISH